MKKAWALCLAAGVTASLLTGCGSSVPAGAYSDELLSASPPGDGKVTLTLRAEYNVNNDAIVSALEKQFPDVNFVPVFHCSQETQYELRQSLEHSSAEDIIISPNMKAISDIAPDYLLDLSAEDCTGNYIGSALEACQINGKLYDLPGPSSVYGIIYDKTLFAEKGWSVPHSYDELAALCKTADASGIRGFQPTCKYARQAQLVFTMFSYAQTFGGVDNYRWLLNYQSGAVPSAQQLAPALERYQQLHADGLILPGDFDVQPGNRSSMLYKDHTCAMIIETEQAELYAQQAGSDHQFGILPFWCGNGPDDDYLMSQPSWYIGLNRALADKGSESKLAAAKEALRYISTPEGQEAISGGTMTQISNVQDVPYTETPFNAGVQDTIRKGHLVPEVDLMVSGNNNAAEKALQADLRKLLEGTMTAGELTADVDAARDKALSAGGIRGSRGGEAKTDFTRLQTGLFIADALRQKAGADIGLCLVGTVRCGMVGRIYAGDLYDADVVSLSLSVGTTGKDPNDKKLWLVSMSGQEILELLKMGYATDLSDGMPGMSYYTASGLKIRFAPWKEDKLVSVQLSDGGKLQPDGTYTVALWGWPFETPCPGTVEKVFDDSCDEILSAAIQTASPLQPFSDERFQLVY